MKISRAAVAIALSGALIGLAFASASFAGCGRGTSAPPAVSASASVRSPSSSSEAEEEPLPALDPAAAALWDAASDGDDDDLARLANREGAAGLVSRARDPARRRTAIRALAFAEDFSGLPFLADVATTGKDEEALAALAAMHDRVAQPRRQRDPEDAEELKAGCDKLLALAKSGASAERRRRAVNILRMLSDFGCVKAADVPTDLDSK